MWGRFRPVSGECIKFPCDFVKHLPTFSKLALIWRTRCAGLKCSFIGHHQREQHREAWKRQSGFAGDLPALSARNGVPSTSSQNDAMLGLIGWEEPGLSSKIEGAVRSPEQGGVLRSGAPSWGGGVPALGLGCNGAEFPGEAGSEGLKPALAPAPRAIGAHFLAALRTALAGHFGPLPQGSSMPGGTVNRVRPSAGGGGCSQPHLGRFRRQTLVDVPPTHLDPPSGIVTSDMSRPTSTESGRHGPSKLARGMPEITRN